MGKDKGWDYLNSDDVNETFNSDDEDELNVSFTSSEFK